LKGNQNYLNELTIFENKEFGEIRTIEENEKVLFCGSDIARALGYDQPHKAIDNTL
jgi:anti-repressor protein